MHLVRTGKPHRSFSLTLSGLPALLAFTKQMTGQLETARQES